MKELKGTENSTMDLRVSHKTLADCDFNIPVTSPEEGYKFMEVLRCYDYFQLGHSRDSKLEYYNKDNQKWEEWYNEEGDDIYDYAEYIDLDYNDIWLMNPQKEIVNPEKVIPNIYVKENEELIKPKELKKIEKLVYKLDDFIKNNRCYIEITTKYNKIIINCDTKDRVSCNKDYDLCELYSIEFLLKNGAMSNIKISDLTYVFVEYDENKNIKSLEFNYEKDYYIYISSYKTK